MCQRLDDEVGREVVGGATSDTAGMAAPSRSRFQTIPSHTITSNPFYMLVIVADRVRRQASPVTVLFGGSIGRAYLLWPVVIVEAGSAGGFHEAVYQFGQSLWRFDE